MTVREVQIICLEQGGQEKNAIKASQINEQLGTDLSLIVNLCRDKRIAEIWDSDITHMLSWIELWRACR